ncbi:MAPEG family protein [Glaciecola petra]|uniref:MAPEG family protein n=1 Tax=Glaciecola petra TaxID=3075602 RepID=A0ABU2ZLE6_9ALTE|nr:MAPEG family protein [Aestuariibacter sp. P117]MDT0593443.1 MAPEG family protein [Aestuariibacter sp. P117]
MFVIIICVAIVVFMPLIAKIPVAIKMSQAGGYDNKYPRKQQATLGGLGERALAAHQNCYEAIAYFAPTVILVMALDEHTVNTVQLSLVFVIARLCYLVCYWANWDKVRSAFWLIGMATIIGHYWLLLA